MVFNDTVYTSSAALVALAAKSRMRPVKQVVNMKPLSKSFPSWVKFIAAFSLLAPIFQNDDEQRAHREHAGNSLLVSFACMCRFAICL